MEIAHSRNNLLKNMFDLCFGQASVRVIFFLVTAETLGADVLHDKYYPQTVINCMV